MSEHLSGESPPSASCSRRTPQGSLWSWSPVWPSDHSGWPRSYPERTLGLRHGDQGVSFSMLTRSDRTPRVCQNGHTFRQNTQSVSDEGHTQTEHPECVRRSHIQTEHPECVRRSHIQTEHPECVRRGHTFRQNTESVSDEDTFSGARQ